MEKSLKQSSENSRSVPLKPGLVVAKSPIPTISIKSYFQTWSNLNFVGSRLIFIFNSTIAYLITIMYPIIFDFSKPTYYQSFLVLLLFFIIVVCFNIISYNQNEIKKSAVHISALFKSNEEFRGIKHDFYGFKHNF